MSLEKYKKKRNLKESGEPSGGSPSGNNKFVVHKHDASRLHYDFRLEVEGVLKSWAVPKGPSMNPKDKRLAIMVEDHPLDYGNFEGVIPGGYGAGTVMLWDKGDFENLKEGNLLDDLKEGHLTVNLKGRKLKGGFALTKLKGRKNQWLLVKMNDRHSTEKKDVLKEEKSVKTGRTLKQIEKDEES